MGKKRRRQGEVFCPTWMVTLGDCMSLLVTFFVLLLTFSTIKSDRLMEVIGVIQGAPHSVDDWRISAATPAARVERTSEREEVSASRGEWDEHYVASQSMAPVNLVEDDIHIRFATMKARLETLGFSNIVTVGQLDEGIHVTFPAEALFQADSAEFRPEAIALIQAFAGLCNNIGNEIRVVQLCGTPGSGQAVEIGRAWSLGMTRAQRVGELLVGQFKVPRERLSSGVSAGHAEPRDRLRLLLVERVGVRRVSIEQLVRTGYPEE